MNCPHCLAEVDLSAEQCGRCGGAIPRRAFSSLPPPPHLRASERREATVVFCDLGGYTRWNEEEDPEDVALVMEVIRAESTRIFEAHGGIVNQFIGDEVMALFGVVASHEDDSARALAAALAFHAYLRAGTPFGKRRPGPLRLHSGAESGLIYARAHDLRSGLFDVTGEAVNTAARLRARAGNDELLCGPALQRQVEYFYRLEPLEPMRLHAAAEPIVPFRVLEPSTSTRFDVATLRGLTRYENRESELQAMIETWRRAERGSGGLIAVVGHPGIGKTRFLHELRARIGSALVLHGRCSAYRNVAPYHPFIQALGSLLELEAFPDRTAATQLASLCDRHRLSPATRHSLSYLLAPGSRAPEVTDRPDSAELRATIVSALAELIAAIAAEHPVLFILEDWHWADEASRSALRQLGQDAEGRAVLIAITYRSTDLTESAQPKTMLRIELQPLDSSHTESMARNVLGGGQLPSGFSSFVHDRTLGNPLFVEEICRSLVEGGSCRVQSDSIVLLEPLFQLRAPATVQAIVRSRIDRLPAEQRTVLRLASVIGAQFTLEFVELLWNEAIEAPDVSSRAQLLGILHELERQDMVYRDAAYPTNYRFKHAITCEVVYESLPVRARKQHHARLAHEMEARALADELEPLYETLAHHYRLGDQREKAIDFAVRAGDKAWRSFSLDQAAVQYQHAIEALEELAGESDAARSRHVDVSLSWARVGIYNPHEAQLAALRNSLAFARERGDRRRAALCLNWLSWIEFGLGDHLPSLQHAEQFLNEATALAETRLITHALFDLGRCRMVGCEYTRAVEAFERALHTRDGTYRAAQSFALSNIAMILADQGDFAGARARIEESEHVAQGSLSLVGPLLILRSLVACWQGAWEAALAASTEAREIGQRIEGKYILGMSALLHGYASFMTSLDPRALVSMREGIDQLESPGIRLHMSCNLALLASGHASAGQYDEAEAAADKALVRAREGDRQGEAEALRVSALVAALRDRQFSKAEGLLEQAVAAAQAKSSERVVVLCELSSAAIQRARGDQQGADTLAQHARAHAHRIGMALPREAAAREDQLERR
ncbi:MAG TPA: AAA family ATPase [Polyangiales bacterium]|nr:AAA family ATPase [Polyangiales bacterium]